MADPRIAFVCPGQGSQHSGMLAAVPENDAFERLIDAAEALSGLPLRKIEAAEDPAALADTRVAQPLLYLTDWAWGVALMECGIVPDVLAGHSLGELAALALAGAFSVEAGLELVVERSRLMAITAEQTPGTMAAVLGLSSDVIREAVDAIGGVWVANDNSPGQVVISGTHAGIEDATRALSEAGARRIVPLSVAGPFHSPLMEPAALAFGELLAGTEFRDATIPVVQNTVPEPEVRGEVLRTRLAAQITTPVRWMETMRTLVAQGPLALVETGPGSVLRGLARGMEDVNALSVEDAGLERIAEEVSA